MKFGIGLYNSRSMPRVDPKINTFLDASFRCCPASVFAMASKNKHNGRVFVIVTLLATVVVIPITLMILAAIGEKSGVEFSPDDFTMRSFDYCRLPYINWTHRGIEYKNLPNSSAQILIDDGWVGVNVRTPKRWHLVSESEGQSTFRMSADCDARFLTNYFDFTDSNGDNLIMKWTNDHQKPAKAFWPLIAEMARDRLYLPIPDLMEFVLDYQINDTLTEKFVAELEQKVGDAWFEAARSDQLKGNHQRALTRFDNAIRISGTHPQAEQAKAESESAVDRGEDQSP